MNYGPSDVAMFRRDLRAAVEHYFTLFSESFDYEDSFVSADYSISEDSFDEAELEVFRSVLDSENRNTALSELHPGDTVRGCRAVINDRICNPDLAINRQGIDLFNFVMECALPSDDRRNPQCCMQGETAKEFGSRFVRDLLDIIPVTTGSRREAHERYDRSQALQPLRPILQITAPTVNNPAWPQSDLALGKLLLLVDYYRELRRVDTISPDSDNT